MPKIVPVFLICPKGKFQTITEDQFKMFNTHKKLQPVGEKVFATWFANVKTYDARRKFTIGDDDPFEETDLMHDSYYNYENPDEVEIVFNGGKRPVPRNTYYEISRNVLQLTPALYTTEDDWFFEAPEVLNFVRNDKFYSFIGAPYYEEQAGVTVKVEEQSATTEKITLKYTSTRDEEDIKTEFEYEYTVKSTYY